MLQNEKWKHQENAQQSPRDPIVETITSRVASSDERIQEGSSGYYSRFHFVVMEEHILVKIRRIFVMVV